MSYPYLTHRSYHCGHAPEIIHISRSPSSSRLVHTVVSRVPASVKRTMLMYSTLEKCVQCASANLPEGLDSRGRESRIATEQGIRRGDNHDGEKRNGFEEVLDGFRYGIGGERRVLHEQRDDEENGSFVRHSKGLGGYKRAERRYATYAQLESEGLGVRPRFDFERDCERAEEEQSPPVPVPVEVPNPVPHQDVQSADQVEREKLREQRESHSERLSLEARPQIRRRPSPLTLRQCHDDDEYIKTRLSPDRIIHRNAAGFFDMTRLPSPTSPTCTSPPWDPRRSTGSTGSAQIRRKPVPRGTSATWHSAEAKLMRNSSSSAKGHRRAETEGCESPTPRHGPLKALWRVVTKADV